MLAIRALNTFKSSSIVEAKVGTIICFRYLEEFERSSISLSLSLSIYMVGTFTYFGYMQLFGTLVYFGHLAYVGYLEVVGTFIYFGLVEVVGTFVYFG